jgi:hypothetical protein
VHQAGKEDAVEPLKDSFFRNFYNEAYFQYWIWDKKYNSFSEIQEHDEMKWQVKFNHTVCTGIFPDHLKSSIVKWLFKKGNNLSRLITGLSHS